MDTFQRMDIGMADITIFGFALLLSGLILRKYKNNHSVLIGLMVLVIMIPLSSQQGLWS